MSSALAIIRIKGQIHVNKDVENTFKLLRLYKKHNCVIVKPDSITIGMLEKIKDFVTWGEIDQETLLELIKKRGRISEAKAIDDEYIKEKVGSLEDFGKKIIEGKESIKKLQIKTFRLSPPRKGFESKGIKRAFKQGGVLGYRGSKINDIIKRMI